MSSSPCVFTEPDFLHCFWHNDKFLTFASLNTLPIYLRPHPAKTYSNKDTDKSAPSQYLRSTVVCNVACICAKNKYNSTSTIKHTQSTTANRHIEFDAQHSATVVAVSMTHCVKTNILNKQML